MRRYVFSLLFVLICLESAFSQDKPKMALIPLYAMGVSETEAENASELLKTALVQTGKYIFIDKNEVEKVMGTQSFTLTGNTDEIYALETGKLLSADQVIIGSFSHIGTQYILNAKVIDIELGDNILSEDVSFTNIEELSNSIDRLVSKLIEQDIEISKNSIVTSNTENPDTITEYIFQLGIGSAYSFYFQDIQNVLDSMDEGSLSRIPFSVDFLFGKKISSTTAWTGILNSGIDSFSDSSDSIQIFTIQLFAGIQYIPFETGLTLGVGAGAALLIPNTTLDYIGNIEFGSTISFDIGYYFETLKFSTKGIIPGLGVKYIHSEIFRGSVDQISGYVNLGIR